MGVRRGAAGAAPGAGRAAGGRACRCRGGAQGAGLFGDSDWRVDGRADGRRRGTGRYRAEGAGRGGTGRGGTGRRARRGAAARRGKRQAEACVTYAPTSCSARFRALGSSRAVSCRSVSGSLPAWITSSRPPLSSQRLSCVVSSSGWNWTPRCLPIANACTPTSFDASRCAEAGRMQRSPWSWNHGPGPISGSSGERRGARSTRTQPIS